MRTRGFTLLEMLVATAIMGIAVVGLLSNISLSTRNAGRLTDYDRAGMLAKQKMDELLLNPRLPKLVPFEGEFDKAISGGLRYGWRAKVSPFELPPKPVPGMSALERIELEVWREAGAERRTLKLEAFRRAVLTAEEIGAAQ